VCPASLNLSGLDLAFGGTVFKVVAGIEVDLRRDSGLFSGLEARFDSSTIGTAANLDGRMLAIRC
jgi:hypothetical protein